MVTDTSEKGLESLIVSSLKDFHIAVPPSIEAEQIAAYLAEETRSLDGMIRTAEREIDLIREYRTRLIADVVTGKLDVRGAELPALDDDDVVDEWEEDDTGDDTDIEADNGIDSDA
jgi:type I restriction enzyme, S subunit